MKTDLTEKDLELISESLDKELSEFERRRLNQKILTTEEGEKTWMRYQAISAVMSKQFPNKIHKDFSQGVMEAIEKEGGEEEFNPQKVRHVGSHLKQFAGLTVAASVAAISIVTFQNFGQPELIDNPKVIVSEQQLTAPTNTSQSVVAEPKPVMNPIEVSKVEFEPAQLSAQDVLGEQPFEQNNQHSSELDPYIQNHAGYGSGRTITPYVDIIELKDVQDF
ncbi:MAG: sigma-E factor negative regulatory protein [Pseudomonadota bacterium]